jgi:4-hydroxybenzoate polyprenyltransferase
MALRFPDSSRTVISVLSSTVVAGLGYVGYAAGLGPAYYAVSVLGAAGHLAWQCKTVDFDSRADCWSKFKANGWLGGLIWLGIALDYVVEVVVPGKYKDEESEVGEKVLEQA